MSLCILMASAETGSPACPNAAAWMLSLKVQSGEDLCLAAFSEGHVLFRNCHGGSNQQWYQQGETIRTLQYSDCLTRTIASSQFLLSPCDHDNLLQRFTVSSKNGLLFIGQDSSCLTVERDSLGAFPVATSCRMHSYGQKLTKTALTCINKGNKKATGTLDKPLQPLQPLFEDGLYAVLVVLGIVMVSVPGLLVALFLNSRIRMHVLQAIPTEVIETMEERLAELTKEMKEPRLDQSELETRIDKGLLDQFAALKSSVDQLGSLPALIATMETKISSSVCEMDSCAASISAFGWSIQSVAEQLTELTKEMQESREDQSKLEMKIDQGLVDHMTACKNQVGQLKQLVSSAGKKINTSHMDTYEASDAASSTGSLCSWIHIPGEPCCYLPETYFQVRTADGDEILSPATKLIEGSQVKADDGTWVHVASPPEQHHRPVIKLQSDQSVLVVSDDHRILVRGNQTAPGHS